MKNYISTGKTMTVTAPGAVTSGDLVVVGSMIGVAAYDAAITESVEIDTEGVFTLPKVTTDVVAQGNKLYWDSSASKSTVAPATGSKPLVGVAAKAAGNGVTTVECRLMLTGQAGPA